MTCARVYGAGGQGEKAAALLLSAEDAMLAGNDQVPSYAAASGPVAATVASHTGKTLTDMKDHQAAEKHYRAALKGRVPGTYQRVHGLTMVNLGKSVAGTAPPRRGRRPVEPLPRLHGRGDLRPEPEGNQVHPVRGSRLPTAANPRSRSTEPTLRRPPASPEVNGPPTGMPTVGVVILTMGDRDKELQALLESVAAQEGDPATVVVLAQGVEPPHLRGAATAVHLRENLGIPGGRNAGVQWLREHGGVDVVLILDDDGLLPQTDTLRLLREAFSTNPRLGIVGFRIADEDGVSQRRHVPRLGGADPLISGPVTTLLGGAHAIRMQVIDQVGDFPAQFFYAHEETDFAWRALDVGWEIDYRADLVLTHPRTEPSRHAVYYRNTGRNRVWLAKRHLPAVLVPAYLASWAAYTLIQRPPLAGLTSWWAGFFEGVRTPCPPRRPMRWRTVWRMTRLGRPPVI